MASKSIATSQAVFAGLGQAVFAVFAGLAVAAGSSAFAQELLVSGFNSDEVHRYDFATGTYLGPLGTVNGAHAVNHGPDGLLYVAAEEDDKVLRYDPLTLTFVDEFVFDDPTTTPDETGGLDGPTTAIFGPDGRLYVASFNTDSVLRYDGATGAFIDAFVAANRGGLNGPDAGMTFGPDGHLYVPSYFNHKIALYDGTTGASLGDFVATGSGGLANPRTLRFRSDGLLYVSGEGSNAIHRYDRTGAFVDTFITTQTPTGFLLSPFDGNVYVANITKSSVLVYDGATGAKLATLVRPGDGGLDGPVTMAFLLDPELHTARIAPGTAGQVNSLTITNGTPGALHFLILGSTAGSFAVGGCPNVFLGIGDPHLFPVVTDFAGSFSSSGFVDPALAGASLLLQSFDPLTCRMSNLVEQTFQ